MPAGAAAGRRAHCNLWSARAQSRHTYATVLPATIDGIPAHFGNPTQITPLRMPVPAGSLHEKTVQNGGSAPVIRSLPKIVNERPLTVRAATFGLASRKSDKTTRSMQPRLHQ